MTPSDQLEDAQLLWANASALAARLGCAAAFRARFAPPEGAHTRSATPLRVASPEALGDALEALRGPARDAAFARLIANDARHEGQTALATTQRFTPPWIAEWLVETALARAGGLPEGALVVDPACGGGRLLLTAYRALSARGISPSDALASLAGLDTDPLAAAVTAWALWLEAAAAGDAAHARALPAPRVWALDDVELGALGAWDALERATGGHIAPGCAALVVANPPYMGARHLAPTLRDALKASYGPFSGDLYTAFLDRCAELATPATGRVAVLCQESFLFVKRDRELRRRWFARVCLEDALHLGARAFEGIRGAKASVVALCARRRADHADHAPDEDAAVDWIDLSDLRSPDAKRQAWRDGALDGRVHRSRFAQRRAADGEPACYWWPDRLRGLLVEPEWRLDAVMDVAGASHKTADNARFVRYWWEVAPDTIGPDKRWVPYAKGGPFRKWCGNLERVVDWSPEALAFYAANPTSNLVAPRYRFREGLTWSDFGGQAFSLRRLPPGCVFDMTGPAMFVRDGAPLDLWFWLGLLNAPLVCHLLNADNPTIHYQVTNLRRLPLPPRSALHPDNPHVAKISALAQRAHAHQATLNAWALSDPHTRGPVTLCARGAGAWRDVVARARALVHTEREALARAEAELSIRAEQLYGVTRADVAPLDARYRPPQAATLQARALALDALIWTLAVAQGQAPAPNGVAWDHDAPLDARVEQVGASIWSPSVWSELRAKTRRSKGEGWPGATLEAHWARRFKRSAWHPARGA